jgi:hypothetical protein
MRFECAHFNDLLVTCHLPGPMSSNVWRDFMAEFEKEPTTRFIAATLGSPEPTSIQRNELFGFFHKNHIKAIAITDERFVRGIVTAASWVGVNARAYSWAELRAAIQYAGIVDQAGISRVERQTLLLRRHLEAQSSTFSKRAV